MLFPPGSRPIRLQKSQGHWQVFLRWDLLASPWFHTWPQAWALATAEADRLRRQGAL